VAVDDRGDYHPDARAEDFAAMRHGCGLFEFAR
jgi:hypothetical protein